MLFTSKECTQAVGSSPPHLPFLIELRWGCVGWDTYSRGGKVNFLLSCSAKLLTTVLLSTTGQEKGLARTVYPYRI